MGCIASKPKVLAAECVPSRHGPAPAPQTAPSDRQPRQRSLRELGIKGTQPNLASLLNLLRSLLQVEQALVVLIDAAGRLSYPAQAGILSDAPKTQAAGCSPAAALCQWALASSGRGLLVIENVREDARLQDQRCHAREGGIQFFAGMPLVALPTGLKRGMLCVLDSRPRHIPAERLSAVLANFSEMVTRELEREEVMRGQQEQLQASVLHARALQVLDRYREPACLVDCSAGHWPILCANPAWKAATGLGQVEGDLQGQSFFSLFALSGVGPPLQGKAPPLQYSAASSPVASTGGTPVVVSLGSRGQGSSSGEHSSAPTLNSQAISSGQGSSREYGSAPTLESQATSSGQGSSGQHCSGQGSGDQVSSGSVAPAWRQGRAEQEARYAAGSCKPFSLVATLNSLAVDSSSAGGAEGPVRVLVFSFHPCSAAEQKLLGGVAAGGHSSGSFDLGEHSAFEATLADSSSGGGGSRPHAEPQPAPLAGSAAAAAAAVGQPRFFFAFVERWQQLQQRQGSPRAAMQLEGQPMPQSVGQGVAQPKVKPGSPSEGSSHQLTPALKGAGPPTPLSLGSGAGGDFGYTRLHIPIPPDGLAERIAEVSALETLPELMRDVLLGPLIGAGAFGRCYRGTWQGNRVAVKVLECMFEPGSDEVASKGGILEALISRSLSHPHVVETYSYAIGPKSIINGKVHQQVWLLQAYCNKGPLLTAVERGRLKGDDGRPHVINILRTACDIAGAMAYLHASGVVHGDLSLNNVLCTTSLKDSRKWVAKVSDFGLSRALSGGAVHTTSLRTVTHMPRELLRHGILSPAVDSYSFGVLLWEMWAGERAWKGATAMQVISAVTLNNHSLQIPSDAPPEFQDVMRSCLAPEPNDRPNFKEIFNALSAQLQQAKHAAEGAGTGPSTTSAAPLPSSPALGEAEAAAETLGAVGAAAGGSDSSLAASSVPAGATCSLGAEPSTVGSGD